MVAIPIGNLCGNSVVREVRHITVPRGEVRHFATKAFGLDFKKMDGNFIVRSRQRRPFLSGEKKMGETWKLESGEQYKS